MNLGRRRLHGHTPERGDHLTLSRIALGSARILLRLHRLEWNVVGHFFLKEHFDALHERVRVEATHHHVIVQIIYE